MAIDNSAPTLTLAFEGLTMFHRNAGGKLHVVVPEDSEHHHHKPFIFVYRVDQGGVQHTKHPLRKGEHVTFGTTGSNAPKPFFNQYVPLLTRFVKKGNIKDKLIQPGTPVQGVLATVELPPGDLRTWSTLKEEVKIETSNGRPAEVCFSRFTVLLSGILQPVNILLRDDETAPPTPHSIQPHCVVMISNVSEDHGSAHFGVYKQFLTKDGTVGEVVGRQPGGCDSTAGVGKLPPHIESILSTRQEAFTPNGDCGQVRSV